MLLDKGFSKARISNLQQGCRSLVPLNSHPKFSWLHFKLASDIHFSSLISLTLVNTDKSRIKSALDTQGVTNISLGIRCLKEINSYLALK